MLDPKRTKKEADREKWEKTLKQMEPYAKSVLIFGGTALIAFGLFVAFSGLSPYGLVLGGCGVFVILLVTIYPSKGG
jgi:hypothetical protein